MNSVKNGNGTTSYLSAKILKLLLNDFKEPTSVSMFKSKIERYETMSWFYLTLSLSIYIIYYIYYNICIYIIYNIYNVGVGV